MEGPRAAKPEELPDVIDLTNATFPPRCSPTFRMESKFPLLLSTHNLENIRVICKRGEPVSVCSYYPCQIQVQGASLRAASIGAVCTKPSFQGQGLSSRLLDDVEEKAVREGIDCLLISGTRGLYLRRKYAIVGGFICHDLLPQDLELPFELSEFTPAHLSELADIYNGEPVRYKRSRIEFDKMVLAGILPDYDFTYKLYGTKKNQRLTSYIVLRIIDHEFSYGEVVEYAGDREDIPLAVKHIACRLRLRFIRLRVHQNDPLEDTISEPGRPESQLGAVKILRPAPLLDSLQPYFRQTARTQTDFVLRVCEGQDHAVTIYLGEETLTIENPVLFSRLIFGFPEDAIRERIQYFSGLDELPGLKASFFSCLPIPFPYAGNLNYV